VSILNAPEAKATEAPAVELDLRPNKLFTFVAIFAIVVGLGSVLGGIAGATFTYQQAAVENIVTPTTPSSPRSPSAAPCRCTPSPTSSPTTSSTGPRACATPRWTARSRWSTRTAPPSLDENGDPVMGPNEARLSWIDATSLTTVLNMGIMAYALAAFAIVVGTTLALLGLIVLKLRRDTVTF
jgi:hypothetical protein